MNRSFIDLEQSSITKFDPLTGEIKETIHTAVIFPAKHFVTDKETTLRVIGEIRQELTDRLDLLRSNNKLLEAQRLEQRTIYDLEMLREVGYGPRVTPELVQQTAKTKTTISRMRLS